MTKAAVADNNTSVRCIGPYIRRAVVLLCCWSCCQCALRPIPRDLAVYVNRDIYAISGLENLGLQRYAELTGDHYISDTVLKEALDEEILPAYARFSDLICRIEPQTEPVQQLHALYRKAALFRLQGLRTILLAIDSQDPSLVRQANRMLDRGQYFIEQWQARLAELTVQYGLQIN